MLANIHKKKCKLLYLEKKKEMEHIRVLDRQQIYFRCVENLIARFKAWTPKYPPKVKNSTNESKIAFKIIHIKALWLTKKLAA